MHVNVSQISSWFYELTILGLHACAKRVYGCMWIKGITRVFRRCLVCMSMHVFWRRLRNNWGFSFSKHLCGRQGQCLFSLFKSKILVTLSALWNIISSLVRNLWHQVLDTETTVSVSLGIEADSFTHQYGGRWPRQNTKHGEENGIVSGIQKQEPQRPKGLWASPQSPSNLKEHFRRPRYS